MEPSSRAGEVGHENSNKEEGGRIAGVFLPCPRLTVVRVVPAAQGWCRL